MADMTKCFSSVAHPSSSTPRSKKTPCHSLDAAICTEAVWKGAAVAESTATRLPREECASAELHDALSTWSAYSTEYLKSTEIFVSSDDQHTLTRPAYLVSRLSGVGIGEFLLHTHTHTHTSCELRQRSTAARDPST